VLIGDLPAPVKYFNPEIKDAYKEIEATAAKRLLHVIPEVLKTEYQKLLFFEPVDQEPRELVKAADKLCAKCREEINAGNQEFAKAEKALRANVEALGLAEVRYFQDTFAPSFGLTLDELD
jgi:5'-deoxynucleotidase